jgi:hypothetical protein
MRIFYLPVAVGFLLLSLQGLAQNNSISAAPAISSGLFGNSEASAITGFLPYPKLNLTAVPFIFEAGISLDAMNCLTDIGGGKGTGNRSFKDVNGQYTHPAIGIFTGASYKNAVGLRFETTLGKVSEADKVLSGITDIAKERYNRNLNFQSSIFEIAVLTEIYPLNIFVDRTADGSRQPEFSPYLAGGVGYFSFDPRAKLGSRDVDLHPLHLEGQSFAEYPYKKNYSLHQFNLPFGPGVKYQYNSLINFKAEFLYRKLFTDYLDDVSTTYIDPALFDKYLTPANAADARMLYNRQIVEKVGLNGKRGSSQYNDSYFSFNLKAAISIGSHKE